jgi:putative tryptophan/tyrosine transport system substrate-binding protein
MRRRQFIVLIGGVAASSSLAFSRVFAETQKTPVIGVLWHAENEEGDGIYLGALKRGLKAVGYIDGINIRIENRFANENYARYTSQAAELVALNVDVIVAVTPPSPTIAKRATTTIPIVFVLIPDPVKLGLVKSLSHPDGNLTGTATNILEISEKRLQIFKDAIPSLSRIALLANPANAAAHRLYAEYTQRVQDKVGVTCISVDVKDGDPNQLDNAFAQISQEHFDGIIIFNDGMFYNERRRLGELALKYRLPSMLFSRETVVEDGNLMSYGPDLQQLFERAAVYIDKILKGAKPSELPVELPTRYQLIINLRTAKALGIQMPLEFLLLADEVLE